MKRESDPPALLSLTPSLSQNSLLRLRSARAALDRADTPEAAAAVKTATEEILRNADLLNAARADLEDVFRRARALKRRLEAAFPPPPPPVEGDADLTTPTE